MSVTNMKDDQVKVVSEEDAAQAEICKDEGNEYLKNKQYAKAIVMYTKAIELNPKNAVYFANRSLAHLSEESFGYALEDGIAAVKANPS